MELQIDGTLVFTFKYMHVYMLDWALLLYQHELQTKCHESIDLDQRLITLID